MSQQHRDPLRSRRARARPWASGPQEGEPHEEERRSEGRAEVRAVENRPGPGREARLPLRLGQALEEEASLCGWLSGAEWTRAGKVH